MTISPPAPVAAPALARTLQDCQTLPQLLAWRCARTPGGEAYRQFDPEAGRWASLSWEQTQARVQQWARAVAASRLPAGARIAILLPNGWDAMGIDQAALVCGCVPVPLHAIDNPGSIAFILQDAQVSLLIVAEAQQWERVRDAGLELPHLQQVVLTDPGQRRGKASLDLPRLSLLADWLAQAPADQALPPAPGPEDLAAIVYTSGTTGKPKGVMLTHANVVADVKAVLARVTPTPQDVFLSFLPLSHTFERTAGYYLAIAAGSCVAYARSVALLAEDLQSQRPTVLISVPRIYERIHAKLQEKLRDAPFKRQLLEAAQTVGWRRFRAQQHLAPEADDGTGGGGWLRHLPWPLLRALVAKPLLAQLGGRVRVAVSGGAPLAPEMARCFLGLGLPLLQGYGMTETAPVVSANGLQDNDPATVGRALPGVQLRIGENRELQVRGAIVMKGYWGRPEDTAKAIDAQGWLGTGDQAEIVEGRIRILGRIKEIIVTSTGEKVPPADVELALAADPLIEQALVVGEQRPFIACVAAVNAQQWQLLATELGLAPDDPASLQDARLQRLVLERMERRCAHLARYAMPRAVHLVRDAWTVDNGLMTPTLKLKRKPLMARYADAIEALYQKR